MIKLWLAAAALGAMGAGCWCPCEAHGTTLPLPQQQCSEAPPPQRGGEAGPASQPQHAPARESGPASQPTK
jgi:hypothetical protein